MRDCTFYGAAVIGIATTFTGGRVDWWEGGIYVGLYGLYIMFMAHNEFFMRKMDLLWPERAKTLMELNKNLQAEKKASQAESGEAPSGGGEKRSSEDGGNAELTGDSCGESGGKHLAKKVENVSGENSRRDFRKDPDDRVGIIIRSSYISKSAIRKMRSDALVVEHVLKMRERTGFPTLARSVRQMSLVLSIEDAREEEEELSLAFPENKKDILICLLSIPGIAY